MDTAHEQPGDPLETARSWLGRLASGPITLAEDDASVLRSLLEEASASRSALANAAAWLRARADLALAREDDPEQPGHEALSRGWRSGSYNSLHVAANHVEDGRASLPREQWPPYMRGEQVRPAATNIPEENGDVHDDTSR